jgi:hypothetical protein
LLEAEGSEGIFSKKEMANLGRDNFYSLKNLAKAPIDGNLFERQNSAFVQSVPIIYNNSQANLAVKMDEMIDTLKSRSEFNYKGFTKDFKYMVTQIKKDGKTTTTKHKF